MSKQEMSLTPFLYVRFNFNDNRNKRKTACASQRNLKVKKACTLTKLCNTGCVSSAQKRKTDFLSKVMTESASSCCFCHGSSWFQTGRPDLPSTTTTSRQGEINALMGAKVWVCRAPLQRHGLCCSLSCLWPQSNVCWPKRWEKQGPEKVCLF